MKFYKLITVIAIFYFIFTLSYAKENTNGVGVTLSSDTEIFFPYNTQRYLFEPSFSYVTSNIENSSVYPTAWSKREIIKIGLGIFKKSHATDNSLFYSGSRFGFKKEKNSNGNSDIDSLYISPSIGYEYYLSTNVSLGVEVGLYISNSRTSGQDTRVIKTQADFNLRFHF